MSPMMAAIYLEPLDRRTEATGSYVKFRHPSPIQRTSPRAPPEAFTRPAKIFFSSPFNDFPPSPRPASQLHLLCSNRKLLRARSVAFGVMLNFRRPLKALLGPLKGVLTGEFRDRSL